MSDLNFAVTELAETASAAFAGNEFTKPLEQLTIRKSGEKGQSISFVVAYKTDDDKKKADEYLAAIAKNSTEEFSVNKRIHPDCALDADHKRVKKVGSAVIEFWKAPKIKRTRKDDGVATVPKA